VTTTKRWRLRFSVRTLVVLVTLVCCYVACWGPTKGQGVADAVRHADDEFDRWQEATPDIGHVYEPNTGEALAPLIVRVDNIHVTRYYFCFFGCVAKLPYEQWW